MSAPIFLIQCHICNDYNFYSNRKCRDHYKSKHSMIIKAESQGRPPSQQKIKPAVKINFKCPGCPWYFETTKELGDHVFLHVESQDSTQNANFEDSEGSDSEGSDSEGSDSEGSDSEEISLEDIITLSNSVPIPNSQPVPVIIEKHRRNHDEALLHACQRDNDTDENKNLTRFALASLRLEPFSIINENGEEENALAHADVISKASQSKTSSIVPIIPMKRSVNEMEKSTLSCSNCSIINPVPLCKLLTSHAPYPKLFDTRNYIELSDDMCQLLNQDWLLSPQMKFVSAQLLAGCILQNQVNGQVIIANTVEVYGRKRKFDIHREPFGTKKQSSIPTSLPPPVGGRYDNVYPTTLNSQHGPKLVIGTQTMNFLVTSFTHLDREEKPSVGAISMSFKLEKLEESLSARIYLDEFSLNKAIELAKNKFAKSVTSYDILDQLRQVGTHFGSPSTYYLCRASGFITRAHQCQPYSIFSLSNLDRGRCPSAEVFSNIADNVLQLGENGRLHKSIVENGLSSGNKEIQRVIREILELFDNNTQSISIIGNTRLNSLLEKLAALHQPYISSANESVTIAIKYAFQFFKK